MRGIIFIIGGVRYLRSRRRNDGAEQYLCHSCISSQPHHQLRSPLFLSPDFQPVFPVIKVYIVEVSIEGIPELSGRIVHLDDMAFFRHHAEGKAINVFRIIPPRELAVELLFHGISVIGMDHREEGAAGVFREILVVVTFQKVHL